MTTPNWPQPFPIGIVCVYYIYGLMNLQDLEKVRLRFDDFDLRFLLKIFSEIFQARSFVRIIVILGISFSRSCSLGKVSAFLHQDLYFENLHKKPDRTFCGSVSTDVIESGSPRLALVFNASKQLTSSPHPTARGFSASYTFVTGQ